MAISSFIDKKGCSYAIHVTPGSHPQRRITRSKLQLHCSSRRSTSGGSAESGSTCNESDVIPRRGPCKSGFGGAPQREEGKKKTQRKCHYGPKTIKEGVILVRFPQLPSSKGSFRSGEQGGVTKKGKPAVTPHPDFVPRAHSNPWIFGFHGSTRELRTLEGFHLGSQDGKTALDGSRR